MEQRQTSWSPLRAVEDRQSGHHWRRAALRAAVVTVMCALTTLLLYLN